MAKKDRNKRAARKARQQEREELQAAQLAADPNAAKKAAKAEAKAAKAEKKDKKKNGFFARIGNYFSAVKSEMRRVVWPSKAELKDYSVGVIAMLIVFGVAIWLVDNAVVLLLTGFASLRG